MKSLIKAWIETHGAKTDIFFEHQGVIWQVVSACIIPSLKTDEQHQTEYQAKRENLKEWAKNISFESLEYMLCSDERREFLKNSFKGIDVLPIFIKEWNKRNTTPIKQEQREK